MNGAGSIFGERTKFAVLCAHSRQTCQYLLLIDILLGFMENSAAGNELNVYVVYII